MESTLDANVVMLAVYREGSRIVNARATISRVRDDAHDWDKLPVSIATAHEAVQVDGLLAYIVGEKLEELLACVGEHGTRTSEEARHPSSRSGAVPDALPVRYRAKRSIRTQQLPLVEEIRQKLDTDPLLNFEGKPIRAYRDTPNQSGRWTQNEMLRTVDQDDVHWLLWRGLPKALRLFGLGQRYVVFTRDLVMEAYRLSMHGFTAEQISDAIGIDAIKVARELRAVRRETRRAGIDQRFRGNYGMTPSEYDAAVNCSR